jgi:hypothetical protein
MVNVLDEIYKGGEEIENVLGISYPGQSIEKTAKKYGYDLTALSPTKILLLQDLQQTDYDIHIANKKYNEANSALGPTVLAILGLILAIFIVGILILIVALIWYLIRVNSRPHLYQKMKDLEARQVELKKKIDAP